MKTSTKLQLSRISIRLIIISAAYLLVAAVFYLFKFFFRSIDLDNITNLVALLCLCACVTIAIAGILCVCFNLSISTEHKLGDKANEPSPLRIGKWFGIGIFGIVILTSAFFFIVRHTSTNNRMSRMKLQAEALLHTYQKNIDELPLMVSNADRIKEAIKLLSVMSNQRSPIVDVRMVFQDTVSGIPMTVQLATWDEPDMLASSGFGDNTYNCEDDEECRFLTSVFANKNTDSTFMCIRYSKYHYFCAFSSNGQRFVLMLLEG